MRVRLTKYEYNKLTSLLTETNKLKRKKGDRTKLVEDYTFGFTQSQLLSSSMLTFPRDAVELIPNLQIAPHALFALERFTYSSQDWFADMHSQLTPAFQLATLFLTHSSSDAFWHAILFQTPRPCRARHCSSRWEHNTLRCNLATRLNLPQRAELSTKLDELAQSGLQFQFASHGRDRSKAIWGLAVFEQNVIWLQEDFLRAAASLHDPTSEATPEEKRAQSAARFRFYILMAATLAHEIIHMIWRRENRDLVEPHLLQGGEDLWCELGEAWEIFVFGGKLEPVSRYADCRFGLTIRRRANHDIEGKLKPEVAANYDFDAFTAVPMALVWDLLQQETWEANPSQSLKVSEENITRRGYCGLVRVEGVSELRREAQVRRNIQRVTHHQENVSCGSKRKRCDQSDAADECNPNKLLIVEESANSSSSKVIRRGFAGRYKLRSLL